MVVSLHTIIRYFFQSSSIEHPILQLDQQHISYKDSFTYIAVVRGPWNEGSEVSLKPRISTLEDRGNLIFLSDGTIEYV